MRSIPPLRRTSACSWPRPSWRRRRCRWPCLFVSKFLSFAARKKKWKKVRRRGEVVSSSGATGKASFGLKIFSTAASGMRISAPLLPLPPLFLPLSLSRRAAQRDHALRTNKATSSPKAPAKGALATSSTSAAPRTTATNSTTGASSAEPSSGLRVTRTSAPSEAVTVATFPETSLTWTIRWKGRIEGENEGGEEGERERRGKRSI